MTTRRNYRDLGDSERNQLLAALWLLKLNGVVDRFSGLHSLFFNYGMHHTSHFFPWHRRFIWLFEKELQKVAPGVALPYWDSTVDQSLSDPLWDKNFLGQFNAAWGLRRWLSDGHTMTKEVRKILGIPDGDLPWLADRTGYAAHLGRSSYSNFSMVTEATYHNPPHRWVGGAMKTTSSPSDPVFYFHHCWIDRMWAEWQEADLRTRFSSFEEYVDHADAPHTHGGNYGLDGLLIGIGGTAREQIDYKALGYDYGL